MPIILFLGAKYDLIFGFNHMDAGFGTLVLLFLLVPFVNLSWFAVEIIRSVRQSKNEEGNKAYLMPMIAALFFVEAIVIDLYIISHARM